MEAIAVHERQYKTYVLRDQASTSQIEVVPERGGIVTSWRLQDREIFYLDTERFTNPDLSVRGGIPILFPICGNLPENKYTHKGQQYTLKQHGFARDLPWEVSESNPQDISLTLVLKSDSQTRAVYPFDFQLAFTYRLKGNTLEIHQRYTNHSDETMPFSAGFHPYFWAPDKNQLKFEIPASQYSDQRTRTTHAFDGTFDFSSDEIDVSFRSLAAQSASVTDHSYRSHLILNWDNIYSTLVFWTVKGKDFYCLEPWTAPRNALNTNEDLIHLEPGATQEMLVQMTVTFS